MKTFRLAICAASFASSMACALPGPAECPQPRFTGKAPPEYYDRANPLPTDADTSSARRVFSRDAGSVSCATCHGQNGDGRGPLSDQFQPRPRNFRCAETVNGIPDGQLFWIIRFGSPGTSMPAHPQFSDDELWRMVRYLRQLAR